MLIGLSRRIPCVPSWILVAGLVAGLTAGTAVAAPVGGSAPRPKPYRKIVAGVETTIPIERSEGETVSIHDIIEVTGQGADLEWTPNESEKTKTLADMAKQSFFRRGIWQLRISFKPLRLIRVDVPQPDGRMKRKLVWYLVYRVTNPGNHMTPKLGEPEEFTAGRSAIERVDSDQEMTASIGPHRFSPIFLLRTFKTADLNVDKSTVQMMDQLIPVARRAIYQRERPACEFSQFFDTVAIGAEPVPVSDGGDAKSRWGVVTWTDVDPSVDYLTIQIMGLTNAYRWSDPKGVYQVGDPPGKGRTFEFKTLQLNFYRPGDEFDAREEEIHFGVQGHPKSLWLYRSNPLTPRAAPPK